MVYLKMSDEDDLAFKRTTATTTERVLSDADGDASRRPTRDLSKQMQDASGQQENGWKLSCDESIGKAE